MDVGGTGSRAPGVEGEFLVGYGELLAEVARTGRRPTRAELEERRALGERAADAGHSLRTLVRQHLAATRLAWPARRDRADPVLGAVELAVDAFTEGYERGRRMAARQEEAARREFIDDLLHGRSGPWLLAERAERFGLVLSRDHAVAVAASPGNHADADPVTRRVEARLVARFGDRHILITTKAGQLICVAPGDRADVLEHFAEQACTMLDHCRVAIGRPQHGAGGVVHSYEEALNTLELGDRLDLDGPVLRAAELLVYPVLARDRQAMADLVLSTLGPLKGARGGAGPLLRTLEEYFAAGCTAAEAARQLNLSVRAVTYRLARIHELTGADPGDPAQRYALQTAVIGARLLGWPDQEI